MKKATTTKSRRNEIGSRLQSVYVLIVCEWAICVRWIMRNAQCLGVFFNVFVYAPCKLTHQRNNDLSGSHAIDMQIGKGGKKRKQQHQHAMKWETVALFAIIKLMAVCMDVHKLWRVTTSWLLNQEEKIWRAESFFLSFSTGMIFSWQIKWSFWICCVSIEHIESKEKLRFFHYFWSYVTKNIK